MLFLLAFFVWSSNVKFVIWLCLFGYSKSVCEIQKPRVLFEPCLRTLILRTPILSYSIARLPSRSCPSFAYVSLTWSTYVTLAEHLELEHHLVELNHVIMTTERIRASPILPLYTGRLLMVNLFLLPLPLAPLASPIPSCWKRASCSPLS